MFIHHGSPITLLDYQKKAVARMGCYLAHNVGLKDSDRHIFLFQGPTGMGKTLTVGEMIRQNGAKHNIAFLWISPAAGELSLQSYTALRRLLQQHGISVENGIHPTESFKPNSVTVINWSQVDKDNSKATRGGEKGGLFEIAAGRAESGTELVVIIDEAHYAAKTGKKAPWFLKQLAEAIGYSPITFEVTATPKGKKEDLPAAENPDTEVHYRVKAEEVVAAGMISRRIEINAGLAELHKADSSATSTEAMMKAAFAQRDLYRDTLIEAGAGWSNPLILVQVPNGAPGSAYIAEIEKFCQGVGIDVAEGDVRFQKYLSENKTDTDELDQVASFDSKVEVLIFKQGIALGWDCPRAKILVAFRESKEEIFRAQTVGRIMRMPEHKHYDNDVLDNAYIFTNLESTLFNFSNSGTGGGYFVDKYLSPMASATLPDNFPTTNWSRAGLQGGVTADRLVEALAQSDSKQILDGVVDDLRKTWRSASVIDNATVGGIDTVDIDKGVSTVSGETVEFFAASASVDPQFKAELAGVLPERYGNVARSAGQVFTRYFNWFEDMLPEAVAEIPNRKARERKAKEVFVSNQSVRTAWGDILLICAGLEPAVVERKTMEWENYVFPAIHGISSDKGCKVSGIVEDLAPTYLYKDGHISWLESEPYGPEEAFMKDILVSMKNSGSLQWWWKNGESGNADRTPYFRIPHIRYREGGNNRVYPDFIICYLDKSGARKFAVLEVKDGTTDGTLNALNENSRIKAATLGHWSKTLTNGEHVAGVVYFDGPKKKWMFADTENGKDVPLADILPLP